MQCLSGWQWCSRGAEALGAHQHALFSYLETRFEAKFKQNMSKNAYFWKKGCKIARLAPGGGEFVPWPYDVTPAYWYTFVECDQHILFSYLETIFEKKKL